MKFCKYFADYFYQPLDQLMCQIYMPFFKVDIADSFHDKIRVFSHSFIQGGFLASLPPFKSS